MPLFLLLKWLYKETKLIHDSLLLRNHVDCNKNDEINVICFLETPILQSQIREF